MKISKMVDAMHYIDEDLVAEAITYRSDKETTDEIIQISEAMGKEKTMKKKGKIAKRTLLVAALIVVLVLGTLTVAVAAFRGSLSEGLKNMFHISEDQEEDLLGREDGLVHIIETESYEKPAVETEQSVYETKEEEGIVEKEDGATSENNDVTSVTCNGVTVTLLQAMVDRYYINLSLKVDGLPEGLEKKIVFGRIGFRINGERAGSAGGGVEYCGEGMQEWAFSIRPEDRNNEGGGWYFGETLEIAITNIATFTKTMDKEIILEGEWNIRWTIQGTTEYQIFDINQELGDTGAFVRTIEISPLSAEVEYEFERQEYQEQTGNGNIANMIKDPPLFKGVIMKDGTIYMHLTEMTSSGHKAVDSMIYVTNSKLTHLIDPNEIDSLLFLNEDSLKSIKGEVELVLDNFYIVPLQ